MLGKMKYVEGLDAYMGQRQTSNPSSAWNTWTLKIGDDDGCPTKKKVKKWGFHLPFFILLYPEMYILIKST